MDIKAVKFIDKNKTSDSKYNYHHPMKPLTPAQKLYIIQKQAMLRMRGINPDRLKIVIFEMAKKVK